MKSTAIFLDFDGVLFNTAKEAYVVAVVATGKVTSHDVIDFDSSHYHAFMMYRYLVGPAWNYYYVLNEIEKGNHSPESINYALENAEWNKYKRFEKSFFDTRKRLQCEDFEFWLSLNVAYPFLGMMKALIHKYTENFFIVSTKDVLTISRLLKLNDVEFDLSRIYGHEHYMRFSNKGELIRHVMSDFSYGRGVFVDDSTQHLNHVINVSNVTPLQADWGYCAPVDCGWSSVEIMNTVKLLLQD